jgi:hypothetical protein
VTFFAGCWNCSNFPVEVLQVQQLTLTFLMQSFAVQICATCMSSVLRNQQLQSIPVWLYDTPPDAARVSAGGMLRAE